MSHKADISKPAPETSDEKSVAIKPTVKPAVKKTPVNFTKLADSIRESNAAFDAEQVVLREKHRQAIDAAKSDVNIEKLTAHILKMEKEKTALLSKAVKLDTRIRDLKTVITGATVSAKRSGNNSRNDQAKQDKKWDKAVIGNGMFSVTLLSLDSADVNKTLSIPVGLDRAEFNKRFAAEFGDTVKYRIDSDTYRFWNVYSA